MGNSFFNLFKKEEDEISDIRHYIAYLNQEKTRNFEPLSDPKKTQSSNSKQGAFCDLSNCVNYLNFKPKSINWRENLHEECKYLSRSFEWGKILDKEIRKFEGNNDQVYQMEITWIMNNPSTMPFDPPKKSKFSPDYSEPLGNAGSLKKSLPSKNSFSKERSKLSIGQINVPPSPQESFIISKKYGDDYNFFESSFDIPNGDPFSLEDSHIPVSPEDKNVDQSINNVSNSSDLFFIHYPKTVLTYENNTFLLPKTNNDQSGFEELGIKHLFRNNDFLDREKSQLNFSLKEKEKYKQITKTIERHLTDPKNALCFLKTKYIAYFLEKYEEASLRQYENNRDIKTLEMICESMMKDLRQFIRVLKDSIYYFYRIKDICSKNKNMEIFFTLDNMINFVLSLLFNEEVYSAVFEIQRKLDYPKEMIFKKNLKKRRHEKPEEFGIADKFCLNQKTISYFKANSNKNRPDSSNGKVLDDMDEEFKEKSTDKIENFEPYAKAIDCIKNIQFLRSPTHKLKAILESSEKMMECIDEFYKKTNAKFNKDIEPDDIMSIYIYMIAKSSLTTLITHCNLIEKFLTESSLASISGYYFITLNASIDYIVNWKDDSRNNKQAKTETRSDMEEVRPLNERKSQITHSASNINEQRMTDSRKE